jgi:hypothetical protein
MWSGHIVSKEMLEGHDAQGNIHTIIVCVSTISNIKPSNKIYGCVCHMISKLSLCLSSHPPTQMKHHTHFMHKILWVWVSNVDQDEGLEELDQR